MPFNMLINQLLNSEFVKSKELIPEMCLIVQKEFFTERKKCLATSLLPTYFVWPSISFKGFLILSVAGNKHLVAFVESGAGRLCPRRTRQGQRHPLGNGLAPHKPRSQCPGHGPAALIPAVHCKALLKAPYHLSVEGSLKKQRNSR